MLLADYQQQLNKLLASLEEDQVVPVMRHLCRNDLYFLLRHAMNRADIEKQWLFDRCREVQQCPNGMLDLWARGHYKSTIITFAKSIQDILASHGDDPLPCWNGREITIGIFSHSRPQAKDFLRQIKRELEDNFKLQLWFPDILYENPQKEAIKWSEDMGLLVKRKSNPKEMTVEAWGLIDAMPTGKHFFLRLYDDVVSDKSVTNPDMIIKATNAWALSTSLGDPDGIERTIGTRYHLRDTYHEMIERKSAVPRLYAATLDGEPDGEPVLLTQEALQKERNTKGPYLFACQYLLNPISDKNQSFEPDWIKHYDYQKGLEQGMNIYIVVDPASSKKRASDYTVMWVIGLAPDGNYYHLEMHRDRMNLVEKCKLLLKLHRRWKPLGVGYEQYGMQSDIQHIQYVQGQENYRFHITEMGGKVSKADRIRKLIPIFSKRRFYLQEQEFHINYEGHKKNVVADFLREEFLSFPVGAHDDMLDCLARILDPDLNAIWPEINRKEEKYSSNRNGFQNKSGRRASSTAWAV